MIKKLVSGIGVGSFIFGMSGLAQANIIVGGGFEDPLVSSSTYILNVTPTGWVGTGDIAKQGYAGAVSSGDGNQWFDLNPGTGASPGITQDVFLSSGTTYDFSFLYNGGGGGSTTQISYSLGSGLGTSLSGFVSTAAMNVYGGTLWAKASATFVAAYSGLQTLSFIGNGNWSGGFIDGVTLSAGSVNPVPEPATISLLAIGVLGLVLRRKKAV